jgi:CheY-like chemotaxis protein
VLSIEDNPANSHVLDRFLASRPGTTLVSTSSGADGISLAQLHLPDLILLDLHLPDLPGEEVFTRLRAEPATAGIPIIVLSADATPGTVRRLLARGAGAYLTKPLDLRELGSALDAVTRQPRVAGPRHPLTGQPAPP